MTDLRQRIADQPTRAFPFIDHRTVGQVDQEDRIHRAYKAWAENRIDDIIPILTGEAD